MLAANNLHTFVLHFRLGDIAIILLGTILSALLAMSTWGTPTGTRLIIRSGGKVVAESSLLENREFQVSGSLGVSTITVQGGRARISRDPSPRQYCVKQGWLSREGETALCLPNQVSLQVLGANKPYDSFNY
ncbi:MAG: NusG domain II-containing protein [Sulfuricellaceae bacterium]|nr:NusG domain II-containing protein [Sulfuricellaceae bacterium]